MRIESDLAKARSGPRALPASGVLGEARSVAAADKSVEVDAAAELAVLAHDLNNLLSVVLAANEALASSLQEGSKGRELAQLSQTAAEQGAVLVRRMLAPRSGATRSPPLDAAGALVATARRAEVMKPAGVDIEVSADEDLLCAVDRSELESALLNLCVNALQAMPAGGCLRLSGQVSKLSTSEAAALSLSARDYVVLSVSDTGVGMSAQTLMQATQLRFSTRRGRGGCGLGLSAVDALARRLRGRLWLTSTPGFGTTARLYLPTT